MWISILCSFYDCTIVNIYWTKILFDHSQTSKLDIRASRKFRSSFKNAIDSYIWIVSQRKNYIWKDSCIGLSLKTTKYIAAGKEVDTEIFFKPRLQSLLRLFPQIITRLNFANLLLLQGFSSSFATEKKTKFIKLFF